ncbi:MAG: hypothetical protein ACUVTM_03515 [Candidatus Bathyarchaeia archaeon]
MFLTILMDLPNLSGVQPNPRKNIIILFRLIMFGSFTLSGEVAGSAITSEIVTVDDDLTVKLPEGVCKTLEITPGTRLLLTVNLTVGEIVMSIAGRPGTLLAEARMTIDNHPGVMAKIAGRLAEENVNIIMFLLPPSTKETISGTMLLDISNSKKTLKEIEHSLSSMKDVREIAAKIL